MATPLSIAGISGSLRRASWNTGLLRAAQEVAPEDVTIEIIDISELPLYNQDHDGPHAPAAVLRFKEQLAAADALLFAVPEYNYSITGVLKNAIDWASRPPPSSPLNDKPTAIMGAGGMVGTVRAQLHFRQIAVFNNMHVLNKPEVRVMKAWEKFDADGNLVDEAIRMEVRALLESLVTWTKRLR